ncbi:MULTISPECIES: SHOCT domain-containing protein [unclassified Streptomyces]|uniref:SHOCT domain-containing protein n=1 Tax=unclassified Streptomyces TaxID=2593676 RepID=UPI003866DECF|nr:SHOCT domain-containing protein [Streptomyces sp. NBC_00827]
MFRYDHDLSGWGWFAMSTSMVLFWALIIILGVLAFRALARPVNPGTPQAGPTPEQVLAQRFAHGEIDEDEYRSRLTALRAYGVPGDPLTKH